MIFSKILKLADSHVANMLKDKSMNKKKTAIAKYSFLSGFQCALSLTEKKKKDELIQDKE